MKRVGQLAAVGRCATFLAFVLLLVSQISHASDKDKTPSVRHVTKEEFIRLVGPEEYARLFREAMKQRVVEPFRLVRNGPSLHLTGEISEEMADALEAALAAAPTSELRVRSPGGDSPAGLRMGWLIHKHRLTVVVDGYCVSSCANYLFTAGARRIIAHGDVVVWHGNAHQKDGREFVQCGRTVSSLDGLPWLPEEIAEVKADSEGLVRRQQAELAFFHELGIDHYIARAGQEPKFFGNFTMTVADMAKFGLSGVEAPPGYGSANFCREVNRRDLSLKLHCVPVTDRMLAYERARRVKGEVCQPDGTLRVRTARD